MIAFPKVKHFNRVRRGLLAFLFFILTAAMILMAVAHVTYHRGLEELAARGNVRLELYTNYLKGVLEKYESLPELLAIDNNLVRALLNPHERTRIETLNRYLETINSVSDTLDTYLMNKDGLTIAASNWNEPHPFIGRNFSFRPYFKQAMKGRLGRYFALGTTSSKRGYYFAYPVRKDNEILGAVAIKINIDLVEDKWGHREETFLVSDPDGIIFITTYTDWRYLTMKPLEEEVLDRIVESKRYPSEASYRPLFKSIEDAGLKGKAKVMHLNDPDANGSRKVLVQSQYMPQAGWNIHILSEINPIRDKVVLVCSIVGGSLFVAYVFLILLIQRQKKLAEINRIEERARKALEEANEKLESRVLDRTRQLTEANEMLRKEIIDRKQTEIKLKRTRKELIHAAKLAVLGQMSAGINHELNQPLAAIRSYVDNGKQFLSRGRLDEAKWNLDQIAELTERMAQIGVQLKLFSKKSSGQIVNVPLHGVVDGAMEILKPSLKKSGVEFTFTIEPQGIEIRGNHVLLQQVLVNLISNAMQAVEGQSVKKIKLDCRETEEGVLIAVEDNGPGIPANMRLSVFEPFYTTKKAGQGLGLGLTISDRIVRELGGKIIFVEPAEAGARFEFTLEKVKKV